MNSQEEQQEKNAPRQGRMRSATMGSIPQSAYHSFSPNHSKGSKLELICWKIVETSLSEEEKKNCCVL